MKQTKRLPLVTVVYETSDGDWVGMYIDGDLVWESHSLPLSLFPSILMKHNLADRDELGRTLFRPFRLTVRDTTDQEQVVVEKTGRMPQRC